MLVLFTAPGLGMGRHGTILDCDGEGSHGMAAVPASPTLSPPSPIFPYSPVFSDRVRHRKTPSSSPHPGPTAWGPDREGIEGLTKTATEEEGVGVWDEMPSEWSHTAVRGLLTRWL